MSVSFPSSYLYAFDESTATEAPSEYSPLTLSMPPEFTPISAQNLNNALSAPNAVGSTMLSPERYFPVITDAPLSFTVTVNTLFAATYFTETAISAVTGPRADSTAQNTYCSPSISICSVQEGSTAYSPSSTVCGAATVIPPGFETKLTV